MKNIRDEKQANENESKKLTIQEINSVAGFQHYSLREKQDLIDTVHNLSLILFKCFEDE